MKMVQALHKIYEVLIGADKIKAGRLLHQQHQLLYGGTEVLAEVMDMSLIKRGTGTMQLIRLVIRKM